MVAFQAGFGQTQGAGRTALVDLNLVDVARGEVQPHSTILIEQNRIVWVGPTSAQRLPAGTTIIRAAGQYAIPGLWDMHIHLTNREWAQHAELSESVRRRVAAYYRAVLLSAGVTGIRDMGGDLAELREIDSAWRSESDGPPGPRLLMTGAKLGNSPVAPGTPFPVRRGVDIAQSIELELARGATHIKLGALSREQLLDALAECTSRRIRCSSHVPTELHADDAARLGMASFEHLFLLAENTAAISFEQLRAWREEARHPDLFQRIEYRLRWRPHPPVTADTAAATHDSVKAVTVFRAIAAAGTYVTPTLILHDLLSRVTPPDPIARDSFLMLQRPTAGLRGETRTPERIADARNKYRLIEQLIRELIRAEVPLLAGTDSPIQCVPGYAIHDELALLVRAGLTPVQALRTATVNPARYLAADSLGAIAVGRLADIVLLRNNPLADVANVRQIELVAANGRILSRAALDSLTNEARRALVTLRPLQAVPTM
jgi:imidazolonepropionase-like amidohydrolase